MQHTENLNLNLIEGSDPVNWEPLNENFTALEQALSDVGQNVSVIQQYLVGTENCKIEVGSYTGTGHTGASYPNQVTLSFAPQLFFVFPSKEVGEQNYNFANNHGVGVSASGIMYGYHSANTEDPFTVDGTTVSWYTTSTASSGYQFNLPALYYYVALG